MKYYIFFILLICVSKNSLSQNAEIHIVKGKTDMKAPKGSPLVNEIYSVSVKFELKGKLLAETSDTTILISIDDRTQGNKPTIVYTKLTLKSSDWQKDGEVKTLYWPILIRNNFDTIQKFSEMAYLYIDKQPNEFHTINFMPVGVNSDSSIDKEIKSDASPKANKIDSILAVTFNEKTNLKAIGYFKMLIDTVILKSHLNGCDNVDKKYKITEIELNLSNGGISKNGVKVILENGQVFKNTETPITLFRLDQKKGVKLLLDDKRTGKCNCYIELGDVINYVYKGNFVYPSEATFHLISKNDIDSVYQKTSIAELIDVSIFSDLLALLGRKPNGIIQTQVTGTFITNTNTVSKNADLILFNFVKPYFRLSKFDSKFAQLDTNSFENNTLDTVKRLVLNQIAYLQAGMKVNFVRIGIGSNQQVFVNFGAEINLTNADSLFGKDIVTINYFPEVEYRINRMDNFGLETSIKLLRQVVPENSPFKNQKPVWIFNPQVSIYYYPFSNPGSKIYVRYAHFALWGDGSSNFPQFQFGFKTNLFSPKK